MAGVFTIPTGTGFLDALAAGLVQRHGDDPLGLGRLTVLLPTRRACRALAEAFLRLGDGRAMLLPRLRPIGDLDADEPELAADLAGGAAWALPPALPPLQRQLLLARLVRQFALEWRNTDPAQAALLAAALARLVDDVQTERLPFANLSGLVPEAYAVHWQTTLDFLKIVTEHWPAILAERGVLDAVDRRNRIAAALAEAWLAAPPDTPIIAAGSTGSIPATAELLAVIAKLPQGAIVLPGLDQLLDRRSWQALQSTHPQWGLKQLLERLNVGREAVLAWVATAESPRAALLREALRPSETSEEWRRAAIDARALDGMARVDCRSRLEEATVVALALRQALETPGRTAALVTPDRDLARRVAAELGRFHVLIDDSAGQPLALTPPGAFLRLAAACAAEQAAPVPLLALLKHPLAAGGEQALFFRTAVRRLELAALRGPRAAPGLAGLRASLEAHRLLPWLDRFIRAAKPFFRLIADPAPRPLAALVAAHVGFAEWLAADGAEAGAERLWRGEAGDSAAQFVHELLDGAEALGSIEGPTYPALFDALIAAPVVRPRWGRHPRLAIWGPLEARLQQADLIVLGGLNEGTWPAEIPADPWLSRPMRERFGLPPEERRVGQAAHDFATLAAAPEVLMTRAAKVDGVPTVPSRWLLRLDGVLGDAAHGLVERGARWRAWAERLDAPDGPPVPVGPPLPKPPLAARPRQLSVTQVEMWMRDPYAVYARHVLRLRPLDPLDADPGAADRGIIVHRALERFLKETQAALPANALARLLQIGEEVFGAALNQPGVWAFWWPRFRRVADWIVGQEARWRMLATPVAAECKGKLSFAGPAGPFLLTATADRIDRLPDGLAIIDYKTGRVPSQLEIAAGYAPQLPLEAAIAMQGGFENLPAAMPADLLFWQVTGGREPGKVIPAGEDALKLAAAAQAGLARLIAAFDHAETPYPARPRPEFAPAFSDYLHLARVLEWSSGGTE